MKDPVFLITGGAGFIGSNFIHFLLRYYDDIRIINFDGLTYAGNLHSLVDIQNDPRYTFVKGDIADKSEINTVFRRFNPDFVINFAAESHVDRSIREPGVFIRTNVLGVQNLLDLFVKSSVKKFVQISTDEVYGSLGPRGYFTESTPLNPRSPYSASKASADLLASAYHTTYDLPVNITRCSNNYGPFQFPEKLIPLTILNCLSYKKIPVYGDGLNVRDWIHVEDHCSAIDLVLNKGVPGEVYNVGANTERSNIEIVKLIIKILADLCPDLNISEDLIMYVEDRKGHDRRYAINSTKIQKELHWKPSIPFEQGLKNTIRWYLDHSGWLDSIITKEYLEYYQKIIGNKFPV
jgi:dTDP-glucose 4,6-dehydratase